MGAEIFLPFFGRRSARRDQGRQGGCRDRRSRPRATDRKWRHPFIARVDRESRAREGDRIEGRRRHARCSTSSTWRPAQRSRKSRLSTWPRSRPTLSWASRSTRTRRSSSSTPGRSERDQPDPVAGARPPFLGLRRQALPRLRLALVNVSIGYGHPKLIAGDQGAGREALHDRAADGDGATFTARANCWPRSRPAT